MVVHVYTCTLNCILSSFVRSIYPDWMNLTDISTTNVGNTFVLVLPITFFLIFVPSLLWSTLTLIGANKYWSNNRSGLSETKFFYRVKGLVTIGLIACVFVPAFIAFALPGRTDQWERIKVLHPSQHTIIMAQILKTSSFEEHFFYILCYLGCTQRNSTGYSLLVPEEVFTRIEQLDHTNGSTAIATGNRRAGHSSCRCCNIGTRSANDIHSIIRRNDDCNHWNYSCCHCR